MSSPFQQPSRSGPTSIDASQPAAMFAGDPEAPPDSPDPERLTKVTAENARLRSEIRQAVARAQRAEADATRVRASTKFQVGDLLVKAARHPKRLFLLPRDLLRMYRLRGHRRTTSSPGENSLTEGRLRRSDYTDEIAARLLLPRVAERPRSPVSIAGALDPITAWQWRHVAAVTQVMPHDAAALIHDVDPDIVIVDTAAAQPLGTWSHLGNPAATDRALAVRELIDAAKGQGRPVMLVRSHGDNPGFDAIGATCDLVVNAPGSLRLQPWLPGIDLGCVRRIDPTVMSGRPQQAEPHGVLIASFSDPLFARGAAANSSPETVHRNTVHRNTVHRNTVHRTWVDVIAPRDRGVIEIGVTGPPEHELERAVAASDVVALTADLGDDIVGAPLLALMALAAGRRLVGPEDPDLRAVLGLGPEEESSTMGWFTYPAGDSQRARTALETALAAAPATPLMRWAIWRRLFDHASAPVALTEAVRRLGLGTQPDSVRHVAAFVHDLAGADLAPLATIARAEQSPIREIVCDESLVAALTTALKESGFDGCSVIGIAVSGDVQADQVKAAQATRSRLLAHLAGTQLRDRETVCVQMLRDAVLAEELSDAHGHVLIENPANSLSLWVMDRDRALMGTLPDALVVNQPGDGSGDGL